jgi:hypothetical protein
MHIAEDAVYALHKVLCIALQKVPYYVLHKLLYHALQKVHAMSYHPLVGTRGTLACLQLLLGPHTLGGVLDDVMR